jgi:hypothetical protein
VPRAVTIPRVPFTISHAAAVLPLQKTRLPLAALMIGSMSPDFAHFLPGLRLREFTHSIPGVFSFCWPVSLGLWLVFVRVLEQPTLALLPDRWHARFPPSDRDISIKALALASAAVIVGAFTHVLWDSFTHRGTVTVQTFTALHAVAFHYHGWRIRWFVVLQHLSTVVGMAILLFWTWRRPAIHDVPRSLPPVSHANRVKAVAFLVGAASALAITRYALHSEAWLGRRLFHFAVGGMIGWVIAWLAVAMLINWRARQRTASTP